MPRPRPPATCPSLRHTQTHMRANITIRHVRTIIPFPHPPPTDKPTPTWEERLAGDELKHDAACAPGVDLGAVDGAAQEELRGPAGKANRGQSVSETGGHRAEQQAPFNARAGVRCCICNSGTVLSPVPQCDDTRGHALLLLAIVAAASVVVPRQPKVCDFKLPAVVDQQVCILQVSVQHVAQVEQPQAAE